MIGCGENADTAAVGDEITILGSFSETYKFPATIAYLGICLRDSDLTYFS